MRDITTPIELTDNSKLTNWELVRLLKYRVFSWQQYYDLFDDAAPEIYELFDELQRRIHPVPGMSPKPNTFPDQIKPRSDLKNSSGMDKP